MIPAVATRNGEIGLSDVRIRTYLSLSHAFAHSETSRGVPPKLPDLFGTCGNARRPRGCLRSLAESRPSLPLFGGRGRADPAGTAATNRRSLQRSQVRARAAALAGRAQQGLGAENRRLALRYDRLGFAVQSLLQAACIFLVAGRLAREFCKPPLSFYDKARMPRTVHVVQKTLAVETCAIAAWFGAPGLGVRYKTTDNAKAMLGSGVPGKK